MSLSRTLVAIVLGALVLAAQPVAAATSPEEMLKDPQAEARARDLGRELRCLVCQNQSIDDSEADLARDLRRIVRERIQAGDSDATIRSFLVARYGEFVLLRPPFELATLALWAGPGLVLAGGAAVLFRTWRRRRGHDGGEAMPPALDPAERQRLEALLAGEERPAR